MQYRKKPALVEATQWFRNGDHPSDNSTPIGRPGGSSTTLTEGEVVKHFHEGIPGDRVCMECGSVMRRHGLITGLNGEEETVHPGDYILTDTKGRYYRRSLKDFEAMFEPYETNGQKSETVELTATPTKIEIDLENLVARITAIEEHFAGVGNSDPMNLKTIRSADLAVPSMSKPEDTQ